MRRFRSTWVVVVATAIVLASVAFASEQADRPAL